MLPLLIARFTRARSASWDLGVGRFEHLLVVSQQGIQRRGDDLFCGHGIDEQQQPGAQRFDRRHGLGKLLRRGGQLFHLRAVNRLQKLLARGSEGTCRRL